MHFKRVVVIGVGLIGGSMAMVLREKGFTDRIIGVGRGMKNLETAKKCGIINSYTLDARKAVEGADLIILATPVCAIIDLAKEISPYIEKGAIVTDVGSVKKAILDEVESVMPEGRYFIAGHPVAGTEDSSANAAFSSLFRGRICILTPSEDTDKDALEKIIAVWKAAGSKVVLMNAEKHDKIMAAVSHLPHMVVYTLVNAVAGIRDYNENILDYSAGGFMDFTRIASSSPEMWRDICLLNGGALQEMIERFEIRLERLKRLIERADEEGLLNEFNYARSIRESLKAKKR